METKAQMMKMLNLSAISKERKLEIFLYAVAAIVILGVYFYYNRQITKKNTEITTMTDTLAKIPMQMAGINGLDTMYQYRLRDYYIASSYNSCCAGQFLDGYVYKLFQRCIAKIIISLLSQIIMVLPIKSIRGLAVIFSPLDSFAYSAFPLARVDSKNCGMYL